MRKYILIFSGLIALQPLAAWAAPDKPERAEQADKPDRPVTQRNVTAVDVAATPATDLNLRKNEIPALLTTAEDQPYALGGLGACRRLSAAVSDLDAVLGNDIDLPSPDGRMSPGRVAQAAIRGMIPFGGLIREISGASGHDRKMQAAILAGVARRSFLKGVGQARGCTYPARSATPAVVAAQQAALDAPKPSRERGDKD